MPNIVNQTVLQDGNKLATVHLILISDGVEGELVNRTIIDLQSDISFNTHSVANPPQATIQQIWWSQSYFDAVLSYQDIDPVPFWVLPVSGSGYVDFRSVGGLKVPTSMNGLNNIMLSTAGFGAEGSIGSYVIQLKKN